MRGLRLRSSIGLLVLELSLPLTGTYLTIYVFKGTLSLLLLFHLLSNVKMDMMYSLMICLNEKAILSLSSHRLRMTPLTLARIGW
tara:strand:+ start:2149 stop:2403 length:255 start_codon:yes stop_codon:yes gene_type:complete